MRLMLLIIIALPVESRGLDSGRIHGIRRVKQALIMTMRDLKN